MKKRKLTRVKSRQDFNREWFEYPKIEKVFEKTGVKEFYLDFFFCIFFAKMSVLVIVLPKSM